MVYFGVMFQTAILNKRPPTSRTHKPSVVLMDSHMLPQGVLPRVCLLADVTLILPFPPMLNHMVLQLRLGVELPITDLTRMSFNFQMNRPNVHSQLSAQSKHFGTHIAFKFLQLQTVYTRYVLVPLEIVAKCLCAVGTSVSLHLHMNCRVMFFFGVARSKSLVTIVAREGPSLMRERMGPQSLWRHKTSATLLANEILEVHIHMMVQGFEFGVYLATDCAFELFPSHFKREYSIG
jgi:hypothetical protein